MAILNVVGVDPSLSNFGFAEAKINTDTDEIYDINLYLCEAPPPPKNKQVRQNSVDLERAKGLYEALQSTLKNADIVFVELPVGSQTARAMASYGVCIGLFASVIKPMIQVTATEVKVAGAGYKNATKAEMISWGVTKYPKANWLTTKSKGVITHTAKNEHLADALAAIHAGIRTDDYKTAKAFIK